MEDFEKYIKDNAKLFDVEPGEGHFDRFEVKLKQKQYNKRRSLVRQSMQIAAVGLLLIMSGLYITDRFILNKDKSEMSYNQEFVEAQYYYTSQINSGIHTLQEIEGGMSDEQRAMLVDELSEADTLFDELQADLKAAPNDPRVLEAMLNHYRVKAMIINKIVKDLEQINDKEKDKVYENAKI